MSISKVFVTAGKAVFTVSNSTTGNRYTYKVKHKEAGNGYPEAWFVSLLSGPSNTTDYTYLGVLKGKTGEVFLSAKSAYQADSIPVRVVRRLFDSLWTDKPLPTGWETRHEGMCGRCGKALTVPESIDTGFGPECSEILGIVRTTKSPADELQDKEVSGFVSDGLSTEGLTPMYNQEHELVCWRGYRPDGVLVTIWND